MALWALLRCSLNTDLVENVPWPDRAVVLLFSTLLWPVELIGYIRYLYAKKRKPRV